MGVRCPKCQEEVDLRKQKVGTLALCGHCGSVLRARAVGPARWEDPPMFADEEEAPAKLRQRRVKRAEAAEELELLDEPGANDRAGNLLAELAQLRARAIYSRGVWVVRRPRLTRAGRLLALVLMVLLAVGLAVAGYMVHARWKEVPAAEKGGPAVTRAVVAGTHGGGPGTRP